MYMLIKNIPCASVYYTADFLTTLLHNTYHFFFDGHFLHSKYKYTDKILYLFLLLGSPIAIFKRFKGFRLRVGAYIHRALSHCASGSALALPQFLFQRESRIFNWDIQPYRYRKLGYLPYVGLRQRRLRNRNIPLLAFLRCALGNPELGNNHFNHNFSLRRGDRAYPTSSPKR